MILPAIHPPPISIISLANWSDGLSSLLISPVFLVFIQKCREMHWSWCRVSSGWVSAEHLQRDSVVVSLSKIEISKAIHNLRGKISCLYAVVVSLSKIEISTMWSGELFIRTTFDVATSGSHIQKPKAGNGITSDDAGCTDIQMYRYPVSAGEHRSKRSRSRAWIYYSRVAAEAEWLRRLPAPEQSSLKNRWSFPGRLLLRSI